MTLHVGGRKVTRDTKLVAVLTYAGPIITVHDPHGVRTLGRLVRHVSVPGLIYDAWTASHPAAPTPTDRLLGGGLPIHDCIELVLALDVPETPGGTP